MLYDAGGDGVVYVWDGSNKKRLCQVAQPPTAFQQLPHPARKPTALQQT